jgi:hypothetical protein
MVFQVIEMLRGELSQQDVAGSGRLDENCAFVRAALLSCHQAFLLQSIEEFYRAVMTKLQALGYVRNAWSSALWQSFDRQQALMLLWVHSCPSSCVLTEAQEFANAIANLCKASIRFNGCLRAVWHHVFSRPHDPQR